MGYTRRQAVTALLTANAVRPLGKQLGPFSFAVGWPTGELAPQLLALTVADTAQAVVRGRASRAGLLLAGASVAGLAYLVSGARKAGALADAQLLESLGPDYLDQLTSDPSSADLKDVAKVAVREIVRPFSMMRPDVERIFDISYTDGGSRARLDIYRPRGVDLTDAPVLVQVHGGGWTIGDKSQQGLLLMNRMAARGWVCVAMNYRLAPKHPFPAQIVDVKKAIAWTREHVAEYGGDPSYLVITGGSAGGHLASLAALTADVEEYQPGFEDADTSVSACVSFYGIYDMAGITGDTAVHMMRDMYLGPRIFRKRPRTNIEAFELASPIAHVAPDSPDFFVIHGSSDSLVSVRPARAFVEKMREISTGVVSYLELPGTQHAFEVFSSIRSAQVIRAVERWLEWHRVVRRKETSVQSAGTSAKHASAAG
jgi:acetyl esterase/lipase